MFGSRLINNSLHLTHHLLCLGDLIKGKMIVLHYHLMLSLELRKIMHELLRDLSFVKLEIMSEAVEYENRNVGILL